MTVVLKIADLCPGDEPVARAIKVRKRFDIANLCRESFEFIAKEGKVRQGSEVSNLYRNSFELVVREVKICKGPEIADLCWESLEQVAKEAKGCKRFKIVDLIIITLLVLTLGEEAEKICLDYLPQPYFWENTTTKNNTTPIDILIRDFAIQASQEVYKKEKT